MSRVEKKILKTKNAKTGETTTYSTKLPCNKKKITFEDTTPPCGNHECYKDKNQWKLISGEAHEWIQDAPSLSNDYSKDPKKEIDIHEYCYILPNDVWIDEDEKKGYLLAHIRHKAHIKDKKYLDRHIHLFTFNPDNPKKLTHIYCGGHKGAFFSPEGNEELKGKGGICEASLNVVKDTVYIHYVSWDNDKSLPDPSFLLTIPLADFKKGSTSKLHRKGKVKFRFKDEKKDEKKDKKKQGTVIQGTAINVRYNKENEIFYAINGHKNLEADELKLFCSNANANDGINFNEIQALDESGDEDYSFDIGAHIEFLEKGKIWFVHYAHTRIEEGSTQEIRSHIFEFKEGQWNKMSNYANKVLVKNKSNTGYSTAIDSPAIFKWRNSGVIEWYMFIAGSNSSSNEETPYANSKIYLFSCLCDIADEYYIA